MKPRRVVVGMRKRLPAPSKPRVPPLEPAQAKREALAFDCCTDGTSICGLSALQRRSPGHEAQCGQ
jgi:hypothetical protein